VSGKISVTPLHCSLFPAIIIIDLEAFSNSLFCLRLHSVVRFLFLLVGCFALGACSFPSPKPHTLPTSPAILQITPAPTLDIDATATVLANQLRPTPTPAGLYIVQDGDTLSGLAEQFDTTVEEILAANGLTDPNAIQAGQGLIIPSLLPTQVIGTPSSAVEVLSSRTITASSPLPGRSVMTNTLEVQEE
jgi:LysM repeat protein